MAMAQFVVRDLEDDVREKLKARARRHSRSMEDEVRHILRQAVAQAPRTALGSSVANRFRRVGLDRDVVEWRGHSARAADLRK